MKAFNELLAIAKRKTRFDINNTNSQSVETYLSGIKSEVDEVIEEMPKSRQCYLEDELGDILWDYLNVLTTLEKETGISTKSVLERACHKYEERISGIESGMAWDDVKDKQKIALANEHQKQLNKSS